MIGVYATCAVKAGKEAEFSALAQRFISESRTHAGCQNYDCGKVAGTKNLYCFLERWASQADLDAHSATPFFVENAPKLVALLENGQDIQVVEFF